MFQINRALLSVTDKAGLPEFAKGLKGFGVHLISTGVTAALLQDNKIEVQEVSDYTGYPEILDGRVKTLQPKIHGGLLGIRGNKEHVKTMSELGIKNIDMVVVNLYAFSKTIAKPGCTLEEAIENIDIGGPALLRAAAKNNISVAAVTDPEDYPIILKEMQRLGGHISKKTSFLLACKVFCLTKTYDTEIYNYLGEKRNEM